MRPLEAVISLTHLRHNYQLLQQKHGNHTLAVIKADAYGHGAVKCAHALADIADGFAVAFLEEAMELRDAGITHNILLLEGVLHTQEYAAVGEYNLTPVIQNEWQLAAFLQYQWQEPKEVWLKLDSGMHRAGFAPAEYAEAFQQLQTCSMIKKIIKMTHFACADELNDDFTRQQLAVFQQATLGCAGDSSVANSAAILKHPETHLAWGRAGIALYGVSPIADEGFGLKPVMTLRTKVFGERLIKAGDAIGYGLIFKAEQDMRIGLIACGYADGYPRVPSNNNPVLIDGLVSRVVGRVSMDMMMVELNHPQQGIGSEVELWGEDIPISQLAELNHTIAYELLCHLKRARRVYID